MIVSVDDFNHGPSELAAVLPCTTTERMIPWHIRIAPPEGGVPRESYIQCDQIRVVGYERLINRLGAVGGRTIDRVEDMLKVFLDL
jgi:mRNA interferase MazF